MNRIREIRNQRKVSGPDLADQLKISPQFLYGIERETRTLSAEMASRIAEIFGVSVDYLLGRSSDSHQSSIPEWATSKDKRDFKRMLEDDGELMFDGIPFDAEDREKVKRVMEAIFWDAKEKNKKTYGRKNKEGG
ncbi:helix-turn-helix domain-containing protein [Paenibacillus daejeonensis]|uniref:helix-turn-helix domain-containing protein n=1 Tax=Paenibacillus daejeonensis TaxID=135193 RepID=UPI000364BF12|nr:helix-turn-helix transcriptional regulator [Paenibacillus daejeonensis]